MTALVFKHTYTQIHIFLYTLVCLVALVTTMSLMRIGPARSTHKWIKHGAGTWRRSGRGPILCSSNFLAISLHLMHALPMDLANLLVPMMKQIFLEFATVTAAYLWLWQWACHITNSATHVEAMMTARYSCP